ncbi:MAG: N-acetylglucosamine-6-phosphate deacetylase [Paenibacillaceae bacterium]|jgi:N-acetylglucosamine-6-phosphate deacetylase|nr:N-acetylglucosamine-6-phosphate deacetylase [Paenibacillaceae bacterium]
MKNTGYCRRTLVSGAEVVTPDGILPETVVSFTQQGIDFIGTKEQFERSPAGREPYHKVAGEGFFLLPGFIDIHVHGGNGSDFMEADPAAYDKITAFHARGGTTSMLATTVTASRSSIGNVLEAAAAYRLNPMPGAKLAGVHLEGPFISPKWSGAQNPSHIVHPRRDWLEAWTASCPGLIRLVTLAPEQEGALDVIAWLSSQGIVAAAGHTDATYEQMEAAVDSGLRHAVHTFNAMKGLHHREPGALGAVLSNNRIVAEVIADGHHVHPTCIQLLAKAKGPEHLVLITDAISASGLGNGDYKLGGLDVIMAEGVARLREGGALAGSTLTMIDAFRYAVSTAGLSVVDASKAASSNPARVLGIDGETGSIACGKLADLLLVTPDWTISRIWVDGREVAGG